MSTSTEARKKRLGRFKPKEEIEWLSHDDRARHRKTISILTDLSLKLEKAPASITDAQRALLRNLTKSDERETQLNASWDMLEQTENAYMLKLAAMGPHDLTAFHEVMNPHEPPAFHHRWMCEWLMKAEAGELMTLIISLPPGAAKSTYGSRSFVQWYMGRNPDKRFLAAGHSQKWAEDEFSKPNRNMIDSEAYRLMFPDVFLNPFEKSASFWRLEGWRGSYTCRGAGSGVSGVRANIIGADDLFRKAEDALSETIRENVWRWWTADLMSRRLPGAPQILIMTRWHSDDPAGKIEKLSKENPRAIPQPCKIINIPAEALIDDPLGREEGEWLWCKDTQSDGFYSAEHYETLRATMPAGLWSALYLGVPLDTQGEHVSEDDFQRYKKPPMNKKNAPIEWIRTVMSVDTAAKGKERSDNTAIQVYRVGVDGFHYMVDSWAGKKTYDDVVTTMVRMMRSWKVTYCIVEDAGMGMQILENYAGKMPAPLVAYTPSGKGSKEFRFDNAVVWIKTGRVLFPEQGPWIVDTINEMVAFPNGQYKDRCDAFSQYCDHEMKSHIGGTKRLKMGSGTVRKRF